jgi:hypothetical protein
MFCAFRHIAVKDGALSASLITQASLQLSTFSAFSFQGASAKAAAVALAALWVLGLTPYLDAPANFLPCSCCSGPQQFQDDAYHEAGSESGSFSGSESGSAVSESSGGFGARIVSCLTIMRASSPGEAHPLPEGHYLPGVHAKQGRPHVGCTFPVSR